MDKKKTRTIVITALIATAAVAAVIKPDFFVGIISRVTDILMPLFLGMAFAFVMNIPVEHFKKLYRKMLKKSSGKCVTILSVISSYLLLAALFLGIVWIIVPQLINSVKLLISNFDRYYSNFMDYCSFLERRDSYGIFAALKRAVTDLSAGIPDMLEKTYTKTSDIISGTLNLLIGFVISIYILLDKENIRRAVSLIAKRIAGSRYEKLRCVYRLVFTTFAGFVTGQIAEAVILGVLCFIGMSLLRFDYALLISTLIGITALVPVVGAIVGTIPSAFLLFLVDPIDAVWFVVYIIVLQQLENNFIYPRVVGKSLGIPPLLVLAAIVIGAGIGGAAGILLGVPLMSVLYAVLCEKLCDEENAETTD
ncbi:MAG: AI-2E family transporter [Oscillospiraceae bacterium]|nr:AI-2E family transporter [Oscillospiraceae bacterium]